MPELALVNGRVRTGDPRRPRADALLLADDRVRLVGSSAEVRKLASPQAEIRDLAGAAVTAPAGMVVQRDAAVPLAVHADADPASPVVWRWPAPTSA